MSTDQLTDLAKQAIELEQAAASGRDLNGTYLSFAANNMAKLAQGYLQKDAGEKVILPTLKEAQKEVTENIRTWKNWVERYGKSKLSVAEMDAYALGFDECLRWLETKRDQETRYKAPVPRYEVRCPVDGWYEYTNLEGEWVKKFHKQGELILTLLPFHACHSPVKDET